jgi:hypothetical protein
MSTATESIEEGGVIVWRTHDLDVARTLAAAEYEQAHHREYETYGYVGTPHRGHDWCRQNGWDPAEAVALMRITFGWWRKIPCPPRCGFHKWHMHPAAEGDRGAMPAVYFWT